MGSVFYFGSPQFIGILFQQCLFPTMPGISAHPVTKLIHCTCVQAEDIYRPNKKIRIHLYLFWHFLQQHIDLQPHFLFVFRVKFRPFVSWGATPSLLKSNQASNSLGLNLILEVFFVTYVSLPVRKKATKITTFQT